MQVERTTTTTTATTFPTNASTQTSTVPRFMRDGPKTNMFAEETLVRMKSSSSSPGATKRNVVPPQIKLEQPQQQLPQVRHVAQSRPMSPPSSPRSTSSDLDEVDQKLCGSVKHNVTRILELYAKSRTTTSLSEEEANVLRNDITELFADVTRMEKSAIQNYKKKGIKRRRRRSVLLSTDSKNTKTCASCGTTTTSQWRRGNSEMSVLCNPCGLRFKRTEKEKAQIGGASAAPGQDSTFGIRPSNASLLNGNQYHPDKTKITFLLNEPDVIPMNFGSPAMP